MPTETAFKNVQRAAEKDFARGGADRVDSTHGPSSLSVVAKRADGSVLARLQVEWVSPPPDPALSGGDDGG